MVAAEGFTIMSDLIVNVMVGAVASGTSILLAGLGETVSERSGVVNLGTEGCMLVGALGAYAATAGTGSPWVGLAVGAAAGGLLAALHAILVVSRKANQFASGFSILFLALGLTSLFGSAYVGKTIDAMHPVAIPGLSSIPVVGEVLFQQDPITYLSYFMAPVVFWFVYKTRWGLLLRTAGERAEALEVNGYSTSRVRYAAVIAGGVLAGMGGAQLSIAYANAWFENMVVGRGFIAVALVIFATWHPLRIVGGAYIFGAALALAPELQARGFGVNQFALDVVPYVLTLVVLAVFGRRTLAAAPMELRGVFDNRRA